MPTESSTLPALHPSTSPSTSFLSSSQLIKCSICGLGTPESESSPRTRDSHGVVLLVSPPERICGRCVRSSGRSDSLDAFEQAMESMNVADMIIEEAKESDENEDSPEANLLGVDSNSLESFASGIEGSSRPFPLRIPSGRRMPSPTNTFRTQSQSLPAHQIRHWSTTATPVPPIPEKPVGDSLWGPQDESTDVLNPLLDVTKRRVSRAGRGALFAGSIFRGTQTSGRSAYEVEVKFLVSQPHLHLGAQLNLVQDVNFEESTLSGYLSISHLTDAHPHLTTFFEGEIIGPKYGFVTGARYGATEHDDMRHWGRFEQFRRPSTRADIVRPEMVFRDPLPDWSRGETVAKERDFVFLRLKERFLVPDHTVRDISGASFAGELKSRIFTDSADRCRLLLCHGGPFPDCGSGRTATQPIITHNDEVRSTSLTE